MKGKSHPNKGGTSTLKGRKEGQTWEQMFGEDGAKARRENHAKKKLERKMNKLKIQIGGEV